MQRTLACPTTGPIQRNTFGRNYRLGLNFLRRWRAIIVGPLAFCAAILVAAMGIVLQSLMPMNKFSSPRPVYHKFSKIEGKNE